ncbi:Anaerobic selenocysteine-containing dehydrogenase [Haloechinothrix alba]|uniref:Anaerobic selenocysteine-containing dehydrogenase n=1 Tax=Haloechinothrix alba TaxID=664784 RepID=A0A238V472_9PSEU|nr:molybdopterin oxidoreductase family protein [Haloechinothrix alba]SNR28319.1 Anaerobic selenocysteine-containing dehydrogenase [Haloechinothrix alba]
MSVQSRQDVHRHTCTLCEAGCGITVAVDRDRVLEVRGDPDDPASRGYICPKATALADLHHDPDRLRQPMVRDGDRWTEVSWEEAFDLVGRRLREIRERHGRDSVGVYQGNPTAHNLGLLTYGQVLFRGLGTRNVYSATSVDQLPHMLAAYLMFGHQLLMPVPDIDRTDLFVCLGGNPVVSNGSIMTAPDMRTRLKALARRGGRAVVLDPRRTETAELTGEHHFIRPGTDALLLMSLVHVLFTERLVRTGHLGEYLTGLDRLREAAVDFPPERTSEVTGVDPAVARRLARDLAGTERAVLYGRVGTCTQEFGGLNGWLLVAVNALAGNLDTPGGAMFTTPAVDAVPAARWAGHAGSFARYGSRVRGLPEFGGELPVSVLAEEIETPGDGRIRALVTSAGNPVLSTPNGARLERSLERLDFMVSVDPYLNETTRHADVILPPTSQLERSHYPLALANYAVRNTARYSQAVFRRAADQRHDWEICIGLAAQLFRPANALLRQAARLGWRALRALGPEPIVALGLRLGPHGLRRGRHGVSLRKLRERQQGIDLGPLESRLPDRLPGRSSTIALAPAEYLADVARLRERLANASPDGLVLIGRRQLRSNNSWMHNSPRLVKGRPRCTLLMHPDDAAERGLADGELATLSSRAGRIDVPVEVSDAMMPGVVSLPHGWGHHRPGARLSVAGAHPGASMNDVTDEYLVDELTGTGAITGVPVAVHARETVAG